MGDPRPSLAGVSEDKASVASRPGAHGGRGGDVGSDPLRDGDNPQLWRRPPSPRPRTPSPRQPGGARAVSRGSVLGSRVPMPSLLSGPRPRSPTMGFVVLSWAGGVPATGSEAARGPAGAVSAEGRGAGVQAPSKPTSYNSLCGRPEGPRVLWGAGSEGPAAGARPRARHPHPCSGQTRIPRSQDSGSIPSNIWTESGRFPPFQARTLSP